MTGGATVTPSRRAAFDVLWRVEMEDAYSSILLASNRYDDLSREDHALLLELTLGVLRWRIQLDFLIEYYSQRKLTRLDPEVVITLRLGLYQLLFLSRIPSHAAINESVKLVKALKKRSAAPMVNAVLRAAQRDGALDFNHSIKDPFERLSIDTSHPAWLLERWINRFGEEEGRRLALANNDAPLTAFRFNTKRAPEEKTREWFNEHDIRIQHSTLSPQAGFIEQGSLSAHSDPVHLGWIYLQDEASQLVGHLSAECGVRNADFQQDLSNSRLIIQQQAPNDSSLEHSALRTPHFLDLCAAPGSKTTLIASLLPESSLIVASDLHLNRLSALKALSARLGIEGVNLVQLNATRDLPFIQPAFDLVLLDAPCSGLGTLQRHPEIKWRMSADKIDELAQLQRRMIEIAAQQVRAGGLLTYAVCSTEPEEGEEVIAWFRQNHPEYRDVTRERFVELGLDPHPYLTTSFGARTFPHRHGTEGFFVCVLWRRR